MDYRLLADEILLKLLSIGDDLAFKEIYQRYWKGLYCAALNKINNKQVAEDTVQTIFITLWEKREKHSIQNLSAYLETAVKYKVINYIKSSISKKNHHSTIEERQITEENTTDRLLLVQELNCAIEIAISQLPQKTQTIFKLSRFEQHSNKEISNIMDLSEKAVEYHISQSLKNLRTNLKEFIFIDVVLILFMLSIKINLLFI